MSQLQADLQVRPVKGIAVPDATRPLAEAAIARLRLALWIALIVTVVVPWGRFIDHPHWDRVQWVPFITPPVKLFDVVANAFFYVPYGYWYTQQRQGTRYALTVAMVSAFAVSLCTEATQLFSQRRFPSLTDVASNMAGAYVGAQWALRRARSWRRRSAVLTSEA
jgi:glycopeptide antibiotics resistance protein